MSTYFCIFTSFLILSCTACDSGESVQKKEKEYILPTITYSFSEEPVWADEFDYEGAPSSSKWGYDIGGSGWGNNELQYYTDDIKNASVANGLLTITAIKEEIEQNQYSSARLVTKDKGDWLYGRFEISAKLPEGVGTWPAIWMLPTDWAYGGWPQSGEIDIMEHVGYDQDVVHITVHTEAYNHSIGTQVGQSKRVAGVSTDFHTYRVDWTPEDIKGYIDDALVFNFPNEKEGYEKWPFNKRFHMLLNIAVGGNWGGAQGVDETIYPVSMEVDYVRVYELIETVEETE
ncbi:glycoside hydrolase family 16 protein [Reichenbachiella ulvae]|uniref:Glycoside hydrolase family 16 protein n=1 Tax=Reichenbachiella ulvae TaxID=2980104 RepID=A0ABT3CP59_9BACT|nr:glycoside hydrolase family 16 protein [Reichenbachiella ulvae]MCV9385518.1 glycoside hydrolase family 16 protein [Reichenbachiella ulvae]